MPWFNLLSSVYFADRIIKGLGNGMFEVTFDDFLSKQVSVVDATSSNTCLIVVLRPSNI